ncbi:TraR/DksA family transcriptional regulator [Pectobacteriaceae bacterium CE90]|nr:TraR/DksA family transcriptional regulator [Prodigiosinella sp. LS101]WJV55705.1 TraR/DksA family transcriptional regulator [Prodigiosinella sp. LS101]WJV60067.1 TraR/DksA family transcriptional regulator [Pectobacteriaceae bacterium C111]WJY13230.1 TraR/DksA family transcriptional regulator [Pectobacteriaceae bacterium CE90]
MADSMDISQEQQALILSAQIASARKLPTQISAHTCEDCDAIIPEARRLAIPGVTCCVSCQEIREHKKRRVQGSS